MEDNYITVVSKEVWTEEMKKWQNILAKILAKYEIMIPIVKGDSKHMVEQLAKETKEAVEYNKKLMLRANVEKNFLIYYLDEFGTPGMYRAIVKKEKSKFHYIK